MLTQWLGSRKPSPPEQLALRLEEAVRTQPGSESGNRSESLTAAAVAILEGLGSGDAVAASAPTLPHPREATSGEHPARAMALDLLAADALITYAIEAAADDCESFAARVDAMIERLSSIARETGAT